MKKSEIIEYEKTPGVMFRRRLGVFVLVSIWWVMTEGNVPGLLYSIPVILFAIIVRRAMPLERSRSTFSVPALLRFVPVFLYLSLAGGVDVAWRVFLPRMPIEPDLVTYALRIKTGGGRALLAQVISLMPGTLACAMHDDVLILHTLVGARDQTIQETARIESTIAAIFREDLENPTV